MGQRTGGKEVAEQETAQAPLETTCMVDGDPNAPILLIAMSPGKEELAGNMPLIGPAGKITWVFARRGGWSRQDCYIINVIGEWPAKKNGAISKEQLERYWDTFNTYLSRSRAKIAVCFGGDAFDRLTGIISQERRENRSTKSGRKSGIEQWRGYLVRPIECAPHIRLVKRYDSYKKATKLHKEGDPKVTRHRVVEPCQLPSSVQMVLPTIHPAAVMRSGYATAPAFAADLARVGRALRGELFNHDFQWTETIEEYRPQTPVSVDIETRRPVLASSEEVIVRVGMAGKVGEHIRAWTRPWGTDALQAVKKELAVPGRPIVIHNSQYDVPLLEREGVVFGGDLWDSMMAAVQVQPDLYKGLNSVASLMLDIERWKNKSDAEPERYNAEDNARELQLYDPLCFELDKAEMRPLFENIVMPGVRTLINMRVRGVRVEPTRAREWHAALTEEWNTLFNEWHIQTSGVSPTSNPEVHSFFYDRLGLPAQYNKHGGTTVDKSALTAMRAYLTRQPDTAETRAAAHMVETLIKFRKTNTLLKNFAKTPFDQNNCVHPSYLPVQKDDDDDNEGKGMPGTGRIGARQPNLANQPQIARRMYIPHDESMEWVGADFSQIEVRIAAELSNDNALREALKGDLHAKNMAILGCDRVRAKNVLYGTLYGGGPIKLAKVLQGQGVAVTARDIKQLQTALAGAYPDLFRWRQRLLEEVGRNYYLTTPFGRRRYFWRGRGDAPAAFDFLPQGSTADIIWHILPQLEAGFKSLGGQLLLTVYDSAEGEVPRGKRKETAAMLNDIMGQAWPQIAPGFRVPIEIKWGESWGELQ